MHCGVFVHEGNVVMVKGGMMHKLKASALSPPETVTTLPECTKPIMHTKLVSSATHLPETAIGFDALSNLNYGHVIDSEASDSLRVM